LKANICARSGVWGLARNIVSIQQLYIVVFDDQIDVHDRSGILQDKSKYLESLNYVPGYGIVKLSEEYLKAMMKN